MPKRSNVEHRHHLHKGIWMAFAWFLISLFLVWGWVNTYQSKKQFEANDI